jgi:hypothetical protein
MALRSALVFAENAVSQAITLISIGGGVLWSGQSRHHSFFDEGALLRYQLLHVVRRPAGSRQDGAGALEFHHVPELGKQALPARQDRWQLDDFPAFALVLVALDVLLD